LRKGLFPQIIKSGLDRSVSTQGEIFRVEVQPGVVEIVYLLNSEIKILVFFLFKYSEKVYEIRLLGRK